MKKILKALTSYRFSFSQRSLFATGKNQAVALIVLSIFLVTVSACKKFVQIGPPKTLLASSNVFSNNSTATSAMTSIYTQMFNNNESFKLAQNTGIAGDELTSYSTDVILTQLYSDNMIAAVQAVSSHGPWSNAYNYIYQANAVIEGLSSNNGVSTPVKTQLTAEAKFVRAFWHFYLTNLYGDVPLITSTDYTKNQKLTRTPQAEVYQQIIVDLKDAQNSLNANYVDASDTTKTSNRVRPNKAVATALLARVYLYTKDYSSAITQASAVISNNSTYKLCVRLDSCFLVNNSEAIWQLATPLPATMNTRDGQYLILKTAPSTGTNNCVSISQQLLSSFEPTDKRQSTWINTYTNSSTSTNYQYPFKYRTYGQGSPIVEYTTVLRLAESYLIRAEASVQNGDLVGGAADLNTIRRRAGLNNTAATTKDDLLKAILHERQVEFFTEWGHRWLDLKRTGNINTVMSIVTPLKTSNQWSPNQQLFPIPQSEITLNSNLSQNPGY